MSINLSKGQKVNLIKEKNTLKNVLVGLGWDEVTVKRGLFSQKVTMDCDASAYLLKHGKLYKDDDVVYYGNLRHISKSVNHMGDNLTGGTGGDDEQIVVNLTEVPSEYDKIVFAVTIYNAREKKQNFGMVKNAYIRIVDEANGQEICRYNLSSDAPLATAIIFGELLRNENEWQFNAIGEGLNADGIGEVEKHFK